MGGHGSGGHPSVGRKPQAPAIPADAPFPIVEMPTGLRVSEQGVWTELAPHAIRERTLTAATAYRFARLCRQIALEGEILARIEKDGLTETKVSLQMDEKGGGLQTVEQKAHALLSKVLVLSQRIDVGLTSFRLAATGRPIAPSAQDKPKSALQTLQAQRPAIRAIK